MNLIVSAMTATEWCKMFRGLRIISDHCTKCRRTLRTTIPWRDMDWAGLKAPTCICGNKSVLCIRIPLHPEPVITYEPKVDGLKIIKNDK